MDGTIELTTKRLILRKEKKEDIQTLFQALGCDPAITRYTGWNPYASLEAAEEKVTEDIKNYEKEGYYTWIIQCQKDIVGTVGAYNYDPLVSSIEIGYSIFRNFWGKGFAAEAVSTVVSYLLENEKINRIHAWCHCKNLASAKVLERVGLKQEGILKQAMRDPDGSLADQRIYGVVYGEWNVGNRK